MEEEVFMMHEFDEIQHEVEDAAQAEEEFPFECVANKVETRFSRGEAFDRWVSGWTVSMKLTQNTATRPRRDLVTPG